MLELLDVGGSDVRMVGIWGIGGIGKTTIAKAFYNTIAREFECSCFLANVREGSEQHGGLVKLQNALLSDIMKEKGLEIKNVHEGITLLRESLRHKKILLVLDDVDDLDQLEKLAGKLDWFDRGSRVIITTRDSQLLNDHEVKPIYKVPELAYHEAVKLFSSNAFKGGKSLDDNEKLLVATMVNYARIPLALKVLGSHLRKASVDEWHAMVDDFRMDPPKCIQDILNISYAGLQEGVRKVFLDIACFFKGWKRNDVIQILEGCNRINPKYSIKVLEGKGLIYVGDYDDRICMHNLLEEMGKDKVLLESKEPGERSRLWHHKDVHNVLTENTGTSKIEGIIVKMPTKDVIHLSPKCFENMKNLMIFININARFYGKVDYLPTQLRLLDWSRCPLDSLESLPSNFNTSKIVHLKMRHSRISYLGFKRMENLKSLNLSNCAFFAQSPDVSGSPNLEFLELSRCTSLVEVHPSVGSLEKLVHLDLEGCSNLVKLPGKVNWRSLQYICLNGCRRLESFPEIVGEMKHLTSLRLSHTGIKALPSSIRYLINLEELYLEDCREFIDLPGSIYELHKLKRVDVYDCPKLVTLPTYSAGSTSVLDEFRWSKCNLSNSDFLASFGPASTVRELNLSDSSIVNLPECIIRFVQLRTLILGGCRKLVEIPELPPTIKKLFVSNCVSLERISKLSNILERKESQIMIEEMGLTNCWRLCDNLVEMANDEEVELDADFFSSLLSSQQSGFKARFPVRKSKVPEWFSCQMDFKGHHVFEFDVEVLENFKWDNTGLAICVATVASSFCLFEVHIHINDSEVGPKSDIIVDSGNVWLQYKPFHEMWRVGYMRPLPPFSCRVTIINKARDIFRPLSTLKSCGVHLVMPPNEDICMKLIRAEDLSSVYPDHKKHMEETYADALYVLMHYMC